MKCVFFDRDGIVNEAPEPGGYVESWEDFYLQQEFVEILRKVSGLGYLAVIVTNQRCVARGIVSLGTVEDIHKRLRQQLKDDHGLELTDILFCPHGKDECECRKPKPGMLLEAAERHDIELASSWMIGDDERDIEAGKSAGCRTILVSADVVETAADLRFKSLGDLLINIESVLKESS